MLIQKPLEHELSTIESDFGWGLKTGKVTHVSSEAPTILDLVIIRLCGDQGGDHLSVTFSGS